MPKTKKKTARKATVKRPIRAEDLYRLRIPYGVAMHPGERLVAYTIERMDEKQKQYFANLFVHDRDTGETRQYTHGDQADSSPVWSPDGRQLAFVSTRDKKTGIYLMPTAGGAEKKLIEIEGAVMGLQWMPDARHLVFSLRYADSHFIKDAEEKKKPPVYRHITRLSYRLDGSGFHPKDRFQVYALDVATGKLRQITRGKRDNVTPCISPNGDLIAYASNRCRDEALDPLRIDLFVTPFKGGRERRIPTPPGPVLFPAFSPDGKVIAYTGNDRPDEGWGVASWHIWTVDLGGKPAARDLLKGFDRGVYDETLSDMEDHRSSVPITWSADGKRLFFLSSDTGATNLFFVPARGGKPTRVFRGKCHIKEFSVSGKSATAALIHADLNNPGEIMTCPTAYGGEKRAARLTDLNPFLRKEIQLGRTRDLMFRSFDGTEVQGWMLPPPNAKPGRRYPAVIQIHGGPRVQYGHSFFHEMQYLAAQGYVVFYTNPRGGSGRGETWADAITANWGELDYRDIMAAADYLEKQRFVNPKRLGVTGGSYGGFMTNWIIGHTNRFKAAVTQRSVVDLRSMTGSSDVGYSLGREFKGYPWTKPEVFAKCSPITYYKNVRTPVLIIHSESDLRCAIEQAEQMFVMLKIMGRKVEMVRFPEEPHGLSRHGRPDRRIARLEWIAKWFKRYL